MSDIKLSPPEAKSLKLGIYEHYKGGVCKVIGVARHSETLEELVVYRHFTKMKGFSKEILWVRPKKMFLETVEVNGKIKPRFRYLGKS